MPLKAADVKETENWEIHVAWMGAVSKGGLAGRERVFLSEEKNKRARGRWVMMLKASPWLKEDERRGIVK